MGFKGGEINTVGIVGLGLIGGSLARTARLSAGFRVFAYDINADVMEAAAKEGVINGDLNAATLPECDIILVALYPGASVEWVEKNARHISKNTVLVDCCGVKRAVEEGIRPIAEEHGFPYVGGHPMAGKAKVGYSASTVNLFAHSSMILTEGDEAVKPFLEDFFMKLGFGSIKWSTADEHDRIIAYTSQLAHVLSSAYVKSPSAVTHTGFSAGSFRDMTRVAWLNENMWTELFMDNADYLADEIEGLSRRLMEYAAAIRQNDEKELFRLLKEGRERKEYVEEISK